MQRFRGGFAVVFYDEDGKRRRHRLEALTRKEAEAAARDLILSWSRRGHGPTVSEIWEAFRADRAGRSIDESMKYTARSILPYFGALRPDQIQIADCRAYVADRRAAGRGDGTIRTQLNHLRTALNWAVKSGMTTSAPFIELPSAPAPRERFLTRQEVHRLLDADAEPHIRLAILLMLTTAARVTAVLELTWERIDFTRRQINLRTGNGSRKGRAIVPMNQTIHDALVEARKAALSDHVIEWAAKPVRSIKKGFARAARNAGLDDVSPHVLRHTAAVHMAEAGVPMDEISQYLGHSETRITAAVYARFSPSHLMRAAQALEFGRK
ncbi:tyrosine-type recombinase/integrase [Roseivivax marinus]|uniref:tyrosine-type recombinase/integrase n=1 Tax=Roseivivax marinus TaxID=1379903 RepID=UPI003B971449